MLAFETYFDLHNVMKDKNIYVPMTKISLEIQNLNNASTTIDILSHTFFYDDVMNKLNFNNGEEMIQTCMISKNYTHILRFCKYQNEYYTILINKETKIIQIYSKNSDKNMNTEINNYFNLLFISTFSIQIINKETVTNALFEILTTFNINSGIEWHPEMQLTINKMNEIINEEKICFHNITNDIIGNDRNYYFLLIPSIYINYPFIIIFPFDAPDTFKSKYNLYIKPLNDEILKENAVMQIFLNVFFSLINKTYVTHPLTLVLIKKFLNLRGIKLDNVTHLIKISESSPIHKLYTEVFNTKYDLDELKKKLIDKNFITQKEIDLILPGYFKSVILLNFSKCVYFFFSLKQLFFNKGFELHFINNEMIKDLFTNAHNFLNFIK